MRIISDFHDYYDYVGTNDHDRSLLYMRSQHDPKIVDLVPRSIVEDLDFPRGSFYDFNCHNVAITFCGRLYEAVVMQVTNAGTFRGDGPRLAFYDFDSLDAMITKMDLRKWWDKDENGRKEKLRAVFNLPARVMPKECRDMVCSVVQWCCYSGRCLVEENPQLKLYDFHRVFHPYLAYQEISMFLGNKAHPEKPIPQPDDVTMAQIKGFDKYSFRSQKRPVGSKTRS